jgi:catechol 2,3-dioxygenase-like lactoylglutathione lyase family enzyme
MGLSSYRLNASIAVTDMTRAEEFYEGKLGLSAVRTGADGSKVYASAGDAALEVYPSPDHAGRSTATLATWHVDDVEQMVDELTSNGVTFEQYEGVLESGFD